MGRKRKGSALQDKIDKYLEEFELDDLNQANDMAALVQMCQIELNIEQIQRALNTIKDPVEDSRRIRELHSALRDANQNWITLQNELAINRRKRHNDSDETPLKYIERIQEQAKRFLDGRLCKVTCSKCKQLLGKYIIYVVDKGERGSIEGDNKIIEQYKYNIMVECWKCGNVTETNN